MRLRRNADGSYWIPKSDAQVEGQLDLQMNRVPGTLTWFPKYDSLPFEDIYSVVKGSIVNIIGKGPSMDKLTKQHTMGLPTFAINEAIHTAEKLNDPKITFGIVQDGNLKSTCRPKEAGLIVNARVVSWYNDYPKLWVFLPHFFGFSGNVLTAEVAIKLAIQGGATKIRMLAFDAAVSQDVSYAKSLGYPPNLYGPPSRFLTHRQSIEALSTLPIDWVRA